MTVSMADTAELPRVLPPALAAVTVETAPAAPAAPAMPDWLDVATSPDAVVDGAAAPVFTVVCDLPSPPRAMLRVERRRERRQRIWWVAAGLSAMVAMLGVTVAVLSMVR
jgi:hypothetical protein